VTEQETEWNRGDSHLNANSLLPGDAIDRQTRSIPLARPRDKEPHFAPNATAFRFGAALLKCAQDEHDSVCYTAPNKVPHRCTSDPRFHLLAHAATTEEAR